MERFTSVQFQHKVIYPMSQTSLKPLGKAVLAVITAIGLHNAVVQIYLPKGTRGVHLGAVVEGTERGDQAEVRAAVCESMLLLLLSMMML